MDRDIKQKLTAEKIIEALTLAPFFSVFSKVEIIKLAALGRAIEFKTGSSIFIEGEAATAIYLLVEGAVDIVKYRSVKSPASASKTKKICAISSGNIFSEVALFADSCHSASAIASADSLVIALDRLTLFGVLSKNGHALRMVLNSLSSLLTKTTWQDSVAKCFVPSTFRANVELKKILPLSTIQKYYALPVKLDEGIVTIALRDINKSEVKQIIKSQISSLEVAFVCISEEDFNRFYPLITSDSQSLKPLVKTDSSKQPPLQAIDIVAHSELFSFMPSSSIRELLKFISIEKILAGNVIFKKNEEAAGLYIVQRGTVSIESENSEHYSTLMTQGDSFGEISLITGSPHNANAIAKSNVDLLFLPKDTFDFLLHAPEFTLALSKVIARRIQAMNRNVFHISELLGGVEKVESLEAKPKKLAMEFNLKSPTIAADSIFQLAAGKASDIHLEARQDAYVVRLRMDGILCKVGQAINKSLGIEIINHLKVHAGLDISQKHLPQDGHLEMQLQNMKVQARVSVVPGYYGETLVARLAQNSNLLPLQKLCTFAEDISFFESMANKKHGVFLVSGPSGAGKTTTIYSLLKAIGTEKKNIITVEDPVELVLENATQLEVSFQDPTKYNNVLRSIFRQDPDIILIGEIRDAASAKIAFEAGLTGHLVLATVHSNNAIDTLNRMREFGVADSVLADGLLGVSAQRLVRSPCPFCVQMTPINAREAAWFASVNLAAPKEVPSNSGCEHCANEGYLGRRAIFEYWAKSPKIRSCIEHGVGFEPLLIELSQSGFITMEEQAIKLVNQGKLNINQVLEKIVDIETGVTKRFLRKVA